MRVPSRSRCRNSSMATPYGPGALLFFCLWMVAESSASVISPSLNVVLFGTMLVVGMVFVRLFSFSGGAQCTVDR